MKLKEIRKKISEMHKEKDGITFDSDVQISIDESEEEESEEEILDIDTFRN